MEGSSFLPRRQESRCSPSAGCDGFPSLHSLPLPVSLPMASDAPACHALLSVRWSSFQALGGVTDLIMNENPPDWCAVAHCICVQTVCATSPQARWLCVLTVVRLWSLPGFSQEPPQREGPCALCSVSRVHLDQLVMRRYSPGCEYTVPTSILKEPTRVPLRSRFLE